MFYILTITWVAPKFNVANAVSFVLLRQLVVMSVIDHYAIFGARQFSVDPKCIVGLLFMVFGVSLSLGNLAKL